MQLKAKKRRWLGMKDASSTLLAHSKLIRKMQIDFKVKRVSLYIQAELLIEQSGYKTGLSYFNLFSCWSS